jgi:hypothetical protein
MIRPGAEEIELDAGEGDEQRSQPQHPAHER